MNMDSAETTKYLNESVSSRSSARKMDPSESSPSTITELFSNVGTTSTEEFLNEIIHELSLFQVRNNEGKNETEKDNE